MRPYSVRWREATTDPTATSTYWWSSSPRPEISIYEYVRLKDYIAGLFDGPVDVIDRDALKPHLRAPSARDAVYAF